MPMATTCRLGIFSFWKIEVWIKTGKRAFISINFIKPLRKARILPLKCSSEKRCVVHTLCSFVTPDCFRFENARVNQTRKCATKLY